MERSKHILVNSEASKRRLRWTGHTLRMAVNSVIRTPFLWHLQRNKNRG